MGILINYIKPEIRPIQLSPLMISSLLEGDVTPITHNSQLKVNIKRKKKIIKWNNKINK
jgi:hypothetical protein